MHKQLINIIAEHNTLHLLYICNIMQGSFGPMGRMRALHLLPAGGGSAYANLRQSRVVPVPVMYQQVGGKQFIFDCIQATGTR